MGEIFDALKKAEEERRRGSVKHPAVYPGSGPGVSQGPVPRTRTDKSLIEMERRPQFLPPKRRLEPSPGGVGLFDAFRNTWGWIRRLGKDPVDEEIADVKRRIIDFDPNSAAGEQYRAIRARIELLNERGECCVLAIISAEGQEGRTMTAINLALVMAMSVGQRVVLVDCDLRSPRIHHTLDIPMKAGLSEVLRNDASLEQALYETSKENLTVLPAGTLPTNPAELVGTPRMRELIENLRERYDHVIIDTPAANQVADAEIVCNLVDGVIFVIRASSTPREQALRALRNFNRERIVGMVLNSTEDLPGGPSRGRA
jgi:capsular exopolysaccharide synthesis family protein